MTKTDTSTTVADKITDIITRDFAPTHIEVINESHKHKGHSGDNGTGESHFKLIVVSTVFAGKSRVQQHKMVYNALETLMHAPIHALSITTKTPDTIIK